MIVFFLAGVLIILVGILAIDLVSKREPQRSRLEAIKEATKRILDE